MKTTAIDQQTENITVGISIFLKSKGFEEFTANKFNRNTGGHEQLHVDISQPNYITFYGVTAQDFEFNFQVPVTTLEDFIVLLYTISEELSIATTGVPTTFTLQVRFTLIKQLLLEKGFEQYDLNKFKFVGAAPQKMRVLLHKQAVSINGFTYNDYEFDLFIKLPGCNEFETLIMNLLSHS
jgi:hypothetical protein